MKRAEFSSEIKFRLKENLIYTLLCKNKLYRKNEGREIRKAKGNFSLGISKTKNRDKVG